MVQGRTMRIVLELAAVTVVGCLVTCARERPLAPHEPRQIVYVGARIPRAAAPDIDRLYMLDADSLNVLDSLLLFPNSAAVSSDGVALYYIAADVDGTGYATRKLDLLTKHQVWIASEGFDRAYRLGVQGDEEVLYEQTGAPGCATLLVSTEDGALRGRREGLCILGTAPRGSALYPIVAVDGDQSRPTLDTTVHILEAETGETKWTVVLRFPDQRALAITRVVLHPDGERLLALGYNCERSCQIVFAVCDAHTGQPSLIWPMRRPSGDIAVSRDGKYVLVSDARGDPRDGTEYVDLLDLESGSHIHRFYPTAGFPPSVYGIGEMAFLPDDKRVIFAPEGLGPLGVLDISTLTVKDPIWLPNTLPEGNWAEGAWAEGGILIVGPGP